MWGTGCSGSTENSPSTVAAVACSPVDVVKSMQPSWCRKGISSAWCLFFLYFLSHWTEFHDPDKIGQHEQRSTGLWKIPGIFVSSTFGILNVTSCCPENLKICGHHRRCLGEPASPILLDKYGLKEASLILCPARFKDITLPETNGLHLKMDGWKMNFLLGGPIFRGELLVSGRVNFTINFARSDCLTSNLAGLVILSFVDLYYFPIR